MSTAARAERVTAPQRPAARAARPRPAWGPPQFLAVIGTALIAYQLWTLAGWIGSGPHHVTAFRDTSSTAWYVGWGLTLAGIGGVIVLLATIVRGCRREGRLTFDAMMFCGLLLTVFWDTVVNFIQPLWFYSSNWPMNLNDWWAHAPFSVSPAAGHGAFPVLLLACLYPLFVVEARLTNRVMGTARARWSGISSARLIAVALVPACITSACLSLVMILPHLWGGPGMPESILSGQYHWSVGEFLYIVGWATTLSSLRFFTNERGERLTERGLRHYSPRKRTGVALLATVAVCNLSVIVWSSPLMLAGMHADSYPSGYPQALPNLTCDIPGRTGTVYGPCPGSPSFKMPIR